MREPGAPTIRKSSDPCGTFHPRSINRDRNGIAARSCGVIRNTDEWFWRSVRTRRADQRYHQAKGAISVHFVPACCRGHNPRTAASADVITGITSNSTKQSLLQTPDKPPHPADRRTDAYIACDGITDDQYVADAVSGGKHVTMII